VATFTWDGIQPSGANTEQFTLPHAQLTRVPRNEYTVIAQLNLWYYGPPHPGTPLTPLLGEYWSSDPDVIHQQIEWAAEYGVDAFSIEWTTPRGVGLDSMENTLDDVFLKSPNIGKVRWAIFYDFGLRLQGTPGLEQYTDYIDFNKPAVYSTFVNDFRHFAQKYFNNPQYLTIDGRPVIYVWPSRAFRGDIMGAVRDARQAVAEEGYDSFIVGDEVKAVDFDPQHAALFDGNTAFSFLMPGLDWSTWANVGDAVIDVDYVFEEWRRNIDGLKVIGRDEFVNFQPGWAPQYDERARHPEFTDPIYVPATSKEQVSAMAEMARRHAEPVGSQGQKLIWVNTWNCWGETTTIEPTANLGPKYPAGNYQFDMLEVVLEVYGAVTYACGTP
jgi:glycoprotein endo-alpha-1,2-mannosidase